MIKREEKIDKAAEEYALTSNVYGLNNYFDNTPQEEIEDDLNSLECFNVNYNLLEKQVDNALNKETKESLTEWLLKRRMKYYSVKRYAEIKNRSSVTIYNWIKKGVIDYIEVEIGNKGKKSYIILEER